LEVLSARQRQDIPLKEIRDKLGGSDLSDEEFLLRYIMKGEREIEAMRAAGPPKQYHATPLLTLVQELQKHRRVRYVQVQRGGNSLVIHSRNSA
ncbi:MAG: hypothetical protein HYY28_07085, partial [Betaproteobacteria bacterium]|nr:hypothetical protein [Betaproteobacteria bacterium]